MRMDKSIDKAMEAQFNAAGIFFLKEATIEAVAKPGEHYVGVYTEIGLAPGVEPKLPDFSFSVVNRRGVALLLTNWGTVVRDGVNHLTFEAWQRTPDNTPVLETHYACAAMSFLDFCFYQGNEAIPETYGEDVLAVIRPGAVKADIGWLMPVRLADALIEAFGKMNEAVLGGALGDAMLYGVDHYTKE